MAILGEDGMGFNLLYGDYRLQANAANAQATLRGGADYMQCCTMSGGHQMDLRQECDWSDPYVLKGATARAAQQAFMDRTKPNALGVHYYDEPGLTWEGGTPHTVAGPAPRVQERLRRRPHSLYGRQAGRCRVGGQVAVLGPLERELPGGGLERRPLRRRPGEAGADFRHAEPVCLERLHRRLLLQRRPPACRSSAGTAATTTARAAISIPPTTRSSAACGSWTSRTGTCRTGATPPATSCTAWNSTCAS